MVFSHNQKQNSSLLILISFFFFSSPLLLAFESGDSETASSKEKQELSHIVLNINGELHSVFNGQERFVAKGDKLTIEKAVLKDGSEDVEIVNLIGFSNRKTGRTPGEDRGLMVDTSKALISKWSVDGSGDIYKITAITHNHLLGQVFIRFSEPTLRYVVLQINNERKILSNGDVCTIKDTDKIKIEDVVTNLKSKKNVKFQIVPNTSESNQSEKSYELRLSKGKRTFATIPIVVKG